MAYIYGVFRGVWAGPTILDLAPLDDRTALLNASDSDSETELTRVVIRRGLGASHGEFVELEIHFRRESS